MKIDYKSFRKKWKPEEKGFPTGSRVYKGYQGQGKTLSMVHDIFQAKKKFPKSIIFSNVKLKGIDYYYYNDTEGLKKALSYRNGKNGVLVVIDEAHLFFNKKTGISLDVITAISQQRKDRRKIFMTCQIWEDLDVSLRKQVKEIVSCNRILNIQKNDIYNGETLEYDKLKGQYVAKKIETQIFKHNLELYNSFDTFQKITTNEEYERNPQSQNIIFFENQKTQPKKW